MFDYLVEVDCPEQGRKVLEYCESEYGANISGWSDDDFFEWPFLTPRYVDEELVVEGYNIHADRVVHGTIVPFDEWAASVGATAVVDFEVSSDEDFGALMN